MKLTVWVEVPRGSLVKRELHGTPRLDYLSPVPCPFNYGCLPDLTGEDGDPADALLLGPRQPRAARISGHLVGVVRFVDGGAADPKWVLGQAPMRRRQRWALRAFFTIYAPARALINRFQGIRGRTAFLGLEVIPLDARELPEDSGVPLR